MSVKLPALALSASLLFGPSSGFAAGAAAVRGRVSAPVSPITGPAISPLTAVPTLNAGLRSLSAPSLSGSLSRIQTAPSVAASLSAAPLLVLPAPLLPAPQSPAALPPVASENAQVQAQVITAEGRFAEGAAKVSADILQTLKTLFSGKAAQAVRGTETEGVDPRWVEQMEKKDRNLSESAKRRRRAVQKEGLTSAALNGRILARHNASYTDTLPTGPVTDQKMSGRCWIFSSLNMLRSVLMSERKVSRKFEFSENYLHFFNMLEKSNRVFENAAAMNAERARGRTISDRKFRDAVGLDAQQSFGDGGYFEYFQFLVSKYGLVPKAAMKETGGSGDTELLNKDLTLTLAAGIEQLLAQTKGLQPKAAAAAAQTVKLATMERVWKILATHLGTPPSEFRYQRHKYTPEDFAKSFVGFRPEDYVSVTANPNQAEGAAYRVKRSAIGAARPGQKRFDLRYINLGVDRIEELVLASIKGGRPVYFSSDADEDMDPETGIMHPEIYKRASAYGLTKAQAKAKASRRFASFINVAGPVHAMLITGFDRPDPKSPAVKFRVENSWGRRTGDRGVFHMYREWLRANVYEIVVHKKFLTPAERALFRGKSKAVREKDIY